MTRKEGVDHKLARQRIPRYTVKKYLFIIVISATFGLVTTVILLSLIGFPTQGLLVVILISFPILLYACLSGFHKGLVEHYGFKEPNFIRDRSSED
jgi:hypothetical protein